MKGIITRRGIIKTKIWKLIKILEAGINLDTYLHAFFYKIWIY